MKDSLIERIIEYNSSNPVRFHVPSHKGRVSSRFFNDSLDITELDFSDNLYDPGEIILREEEASAKIFGVRASIFSLNGSSAAIMAAIMASVREGEVLLLPENSHISAYYGAMHSGASVVRVQCKDPIKGLSYEEVENAVRRYPHAKAFVLTSPTYYGCSRDTVKIISLLKMKGIIAIADEAHGTHFRFSEAYPDSAIEANADIVIHSGHKTINGPTQTAIVHCASKRIVTEDIRKWLRSVHSTSPSYPLFMGLIEAVAQLNDSGNVLNELKLCYNQMIGDLKSTPLRFANYSENNSTDWLKLAVDFSQSGLNASEVAEAIKREFGIYSELSDDDIILFAAGLGSVDSDYERLSEALRSFGVKKMMKHESKQGNIDLPLAVLSIKEAMQVPYEWVGIDNAENRIAADFMSVYPPGAPKIIPGELISAEAIEYFKRFPCEKRTGFKRDMLKVVRI